jgi:outer membrane protein
MRSQVGTSLGRLAVSLLALGGGAAFAEKAPPAKPVEMSAIKPIPEIAPVATEDGSYEKISLTEAVKRALARNPTAVVAFQELQRSQALLEQARAGALPSLVANASLIRLDKDRTFPGSPQIAGGTVDANGRVVFETQKTPDRVIAGVNQQTANLTLTVPLVAPRAWANWSEGSMNTLTAKASAEDVRRTLSTSVARAYLSIISLKRQVDTTSRAVANDRSHYDYTHTRFAGGVGTRVDEVRAAQQLAGDEAALSTLYTSLARAREALSVLVAEDRPVDTLDDLVLPAGDASVDNAAARRQDLQAAKQRASAAEKIRRESWTDFAPTINGQFQPFFQNPASLTQPQTGWQAMLILSLPLLEGGLRRGQLHERDALLAQARAQYDGILRQTRSDLRVAVEEVRRADEAMRSANTAAELSHQALDLANLAYHAGATTNIEVIDAERRARDADTAVVVAEDSVRQARLDLLVAAGQFP